MEVPITRPALDAREIEAIRAPLLSGWVAQGPQVEAFERAVARFTGAGHAIATSSGTTALHLALAGLGLGPGDEVIVPAFTWIATANAVEYVGARPVFCDVSVRDFNLDPKRLERCVSKATRAIIPVHLFGLPTSMGPLLERARGGKLLLIEDAACALGTYIDDVHVGTLGQAGCFSFHPRKIITTGEGGMVVTDDDELAARCRSLRNHGAGEPGPAGLGAFDRLGFNYRMTDLQGAMGVVQMDKLDTILRRRAVLAGRYDALLADLPWLRVPQVPRGVTHAYQSYVCLFAPAEPTPANCPALHTARNSLMRSLAQRGVTTRPGTHAVTTLGYYRDRYGIDPNQFPGALLADRLSLTLPLYPQMTEAEQDYVVEQLRAAGPR